MKKEIHSWLNSGMVILIVAGLWFHAQLATAATHTVTNTYDGEAGSLREAIQASVSGDIINFDLPIAARRKILLNSELVIGRDLTITGPAEGLTVSGDRKCRIFHILSGATVNISGLTIANGSADNGGGLFNAGTVALGNCTFSFNNAASTGSGGAILNAPSCVLTVNNCSFSGNTAAYAGAIFNDTLAAATINNSTFSGNNATQSGGAIANNARSPGNGQPLTDHGILTLNNCTIFGNAAGATGGGIYTYGNSRILNTIIAGNTAYPLSPNWPGADVYETVISRGHNLIGNTNGSSGWLGSDLTGGGNASLNPLLGPLQSNGGSTWTMLPQTGSAAIDSGSDSVLSPPYSFTTDERGYSRRLGTHVDIGAVEFDPSQGEPKAPIPDLSLDLKNSDPLPGGAGTFFRSEGGIAVSGGNVAFSASGSSGQKGVYFARRLVP